MLKNISDILKLQPERDPGKYLYRYILIAYLFGIAIRLILLYQAKGVPSLWINEEPLPIWTADASLYGFYAKQILAGVSYPFTSGYISGYLIAWVTNLLHTDIDWVMLLLPIFLAPLIVIPIILISKVLKLTTLGFLSALISVVGINYYMRSHLGYMDTDVLNLFFVLLIAYFMVQTLMSTNLLYALGGGFSILLFTLWYHSSASINMTLVITFFLLTLLIDRKDHINYQAFILFALALISYDPLIVMALLAILTLFFMILNKYKTFSYLYYLSALLLGIMLILSFLDLSHYYDRAIQYFNKDTILSFSGNSITYYYTDALQFVAEVRKANLWESQAFFDGILFYTFISTFGYILLGIAYPAIFILLPLLILGYLSSYIGIRFALYVSPIFAFGIVYLFYLIRNILINSHSRRNLLLRLPVYGSLIILILMLHNIFLFNAQRLVNGFPLQENDVKLLSQFSKKLSKDDKIVTWWGYGWPLWYYTGYQNTIVDNGDHGGPDTHIIAKILMSNDQNFTANTAKYFAQKSYESHQNQSAFILPYLAKSQDLSILVDQLKNSSFSIQNKNETYILLHRKMFDIYNIISLFAAKDLKTGQGKSKKAFTSSPLLKPFSTNDSLIEGHVYTFDSIKGILKNRDNNKIKVKINEVTLTDHHKQNYAYLYHKNASNYIIIEDKKHAFYMNREAYQSFLVQAMLLDVYDHSLFEKVGESEQMKLFKIKR